MLPEFHPKYSGTMQKWFSTLSVLYFQNGVKAWEIDIAVGRRKYSKNPDALRQKIIYYS
jgi:hypothetical protein